MWLESAPMEKVYERTPKTGIAQVYSREYGAGRIVYFPWDIDRTFWEVLDLDHGQLMRNAVNWAGQDRAHVTVTGTGVIDVVGWQQKNSLTVHLVNLTNPMMMKGPIRELIAIGEQRVRVRIPNDKRIAGVKLLVANVAPAYTISEGWLDVTVPSVLAHEVVAADFVSSV